MNELIEGSIIVLACGLASAMHTFSIYRIEIMLSKLFLNIDVPDTVILRDGTTQPLKDVEIDTIISVRPGDTIPLDGVVVKGSAAVDESVITGESLPILKTVNNIVVSGTLNTNGYLEIQVTCTVDNSTLNRLHNLVDEACASASQTATQLYIDKLVTYYTPGIILLAVFVSSIGMCYEC